jgi:Holliday junction resolvase-like predicted endonuclease
MIHLNPNILVRAIQGINPGSISLDDFVTITQIDHTNAEKLLQDIINNYNIGKHNNKESNSFDFSYSDKTKYAIYALKQGAYIDEISPHLTWRNFEELVAEILYDKEYTITKNLILTKPRREIDVIGIKNNIAVIIDCKHWKRTDQISALHTITKKQIQRAKQYTTIQKDPNMTSVPIIVTLHQETVKFINKVPIIPILEFASFIDEIHGNMYDDKHIQLIRTD